MMNEYSSGDLMAAILTLQEATAAGFDKSEARDERLNAKIDSKFDALRFEMNRRFDRVDQRFDALEPRGDRPDSNGRPLE